MTATNKEGICTISKFVNLKEFIWFLNFNKSCGPNSIPTKILHLV